MTRDEIIELAIKAGFSLPESLVRTELRYEKDGFAAQFCIDQLERFAELVAAAEREACAKVCEGRIGGATKEDTWWSGFRSAMSQCADVIRARGKTCT